MRKGWRSRYGDHSALEILLLGILHSYDLHLAFCYTLIGEPAETHLRLRVTVERRYHTIRFLFRHKILNGLIQGG